MIRARFPLLSILAGVAAIGLAVAQPVLAQGKDDDRAPERGRLLLVFAPNEESKSLGVQYDMLQREIGEISSADVDIVYVIGDRSVKLPPPDAKTESADNLRKHYHVDATAFRVVLVGKDGWEKHRWSEPTDPGAILSRAPDMPQPKSAADDQHR
jgi:hypothetical protein